MDENKHIAKIAVGAVLIFGVLGLIIWFIVKLSTDSKEITSQGSEVDRLKQMVKDHSNKITELQGTMMETVKGQLANQGPEGPRGVQGETGGVYQAVGQLINLHAPDYVVDRYFGNGTSAAAYLAAPSLQTTQRWKLNNDNTLCNHYGGCLYGDKNLDSVYMMPENKAKGSTQGKWSWTKTGQLQWQANKQKCLALGRTTGSPAMKIVNGKPVKSKGQNQQLTLTDCDQQTLPLDQQWGFSQ